jgi:hypothetical protein
MPQHGIDFAAFGVKAPALDRGKHIALKYGRRSPAASEFLRIFGHTDL